MKWKIFYSDGSAYTDEDGAPELAPKRGVQVIAIACEITGYRFEREEHHYIWKDGWFATDNFGLFDYLIDPGYKIVLFGRTLSTKEYKAILSKAMQDNYLPHKSAWLKEERR